jgi:inner membrane protein
MSPATHLLASWLLASTAPLSRREKAAVVCAGLAPDLDGLGIIPEFLTRNTNHPLLWFSEYHHTLHTLAFAVATTAIALLISLSSDFIRGPVIRRLSAPPRLWTTALLAFLSFHLHLFCDIIGSRGPDRYQWPIPYLQPYSSRLQLSWQGQWNLVGWQNLLITSILLFLTLWLAWTSGRSPLELVSRNANQALVAALRRRFSRSKY